MKVAILGYGVEGSAAYKYWRALGDDITIFDDKSVEVPEGAVLEVGANWQLEDFDLIVRSPGIRPDRLPANANVTSVVREFMARCPAPIIGVTGTKGKGTTSTLIAKMLEAAGCTVHLGGNIGRPALEFLDQVKPPDWVVLELSSFQLIDVTESPQIGVCLMIVPEHLNWHSDMVEYVAAKANLFRFQKPQDTAVYNAANSYSIEIAQVSKGSKIPYLVSPYKPVTTGYGSGKLNSGSIPDKIQQSLGSYIERDQIIFQDTPICSTHEVGLIGRHNLENICAAVAAVYPIVQDSKPLAEVIKTFKGLEHRLELVGEMGGVGYIDDSFSTTPETAIAAIKSFQQPKILILGGSDKGSDYTELAKVITASNVKQVVAIGDMAEKIVENLHKQSFQAVTTGETTMKGIVQSTRNISKPGDVVLLSPACASFGLFKDYKDRGNQFKAAVQVLASAEQ